MIARFWHGRTPADKSDSYLSYVRETGVAGLRATDGNRGVFVLRRVHGDLAEFLVISLWESVEAVRRFAGSETEVPVYYPRDDEYLLERAKTVDHYTVDVMEAVEGIGADRR